MNAILMHRRKLGAGVLLSCLLCVTFAQFPRPQGYVVTDTAQLDVASINAEAEPLARSGVAPLVMFIDASVGDRYSDVDAYLEEAIQRYDLGTRQGIVENGLLMFVGTRPLRFEGDERPIYIYYGAKLADRLESSQPGSNLRRVDYLRERVIIPALQRSDYSGAFRSALREAGEMLTTRPPTTSDTRTTSVPTPAPSSSSRAGIPRWLLLAALLMGGIFISGLLRKDPKSKREQPRVQAENAEGLEPNTSSPQALREIKSQLSSLLIDLAGKGDTQQGHDAYLPHDPEQQTDMVLIRSLAAVDRPELVSDLRQRYTHMRDRLEGLEQQFAELSSNEPERKTAAQVQMYQQRYQAMLEDARSVETFTRELADTWNSLNAEVQDMRSALASRQQALASLRQQYQEMPEPKPDVHSTFAELERRVQQTEQLLKQERPLQGQPLLDDIDSMLSARQQHLRSYPELIEGLPKRLSQHAEALSNAKHRIREGAEAFDKVDDYAETSWRDIRGNGSSAEQQLVLAREAAAVAQAAYDQQDYLAADDALRQSQRALAQLETNIRAIEIRLQDLATAQQEASQLLRQVQQETDTLTERARSNDASEAVREAVLKVISQLEYAHELSQVSPPDWMAVLAQAQQADALLDEAEKQFDDVRERRSRLERRLASEREEARIALDRVSHFVRVHAEINEGEVQHQVERAELSFVQAERLHKAGQQLDEAVSAFDASEKTAEQAYDYAEQQWRRLGELKQQVQQQVAQAERTWEQASRLVARNRAARHLHNELESLEPTIPEPHDWEQQKQSSVLQVLEHSRRLNSELNRILRQARQLNTRSGMNLPTGLPRQSRPSTRVEFPRRRSGGGSILGGVIGGMLNDAMRDAARSSRSTSRRSGFPSHGGSSYRNIPAPPARPRNVRIDTRSSRSFPSKSFPSGSGGVSRGSWGGSVKGKSKGGW